MKKVIFLFINLVFVWNIAQAQLPETINWETSIKMNKHLFPSYILAGSTIKFTSLGDHYLGESKGLLGIAISSTYRAAKFRLEVRADEIASATSFEFTLPHDKRREVFYVFPNINYNYQSLKKITEPTPVNVTFTLYRDGKEEGQFTETVSVHSVSDCPYYMTNPDGSGVDMTWMLGAYVNENNPMIEDILREGVNTGLVDQFVDYQASTNTNYSDIIKQTAAVWTAMYNRKLTYSNTVTPSLLPGDNIICQRIRLFNDALRSSLANCIDGSAMFASIFRRIGIKPFLVLIPGHCFMGYYTSPSKDKLICLETTVIGDRKVQETAVDSTWFKYIYSLFPKDVAEKNRAALLSYTYALSEGNKKYAEVQPYLKSKLGSIYNLYLFIDIEKARTEYSVIPLSSN